LPEENEKDDRSSMDKHHFLKKAFSAARSTRKNCGISRDSSWKESNMLFLILSITVQTIRKSWKHNWKYQRFWKYK